MNAIRRLYTWMGHHVHSPYAIPLLSSFFFIEANIFFIPVDPLLIVYCIERRKDSWRFATIATLSSVIGGLFGYALGYAFWHVIGHKIVILFISQHAFDQAVDIFHHYEAAAVLIAGFTPLPYKAVTIAAGFCKLPLLPFIIYSFISRGARFFLIATILWRWGSRIKEYIDRYFNLFVMLFVLLLISISAFVKLFN